jgi:hypothetical protein
LSVQLRQKMWAGEAGRQTNWQTIAARRRGSTRLVWKVRICRCRECRLCSLYAQSSGRGSLLRSSAHIMLLMQGNVPAIVLFPTPPFADDTAIIFLTSFIPFFCGSPRCMRGSCGGAPERGRPCDKVVQPLQSGSACGKPTRGFSCRRHRSVENNRGFNMTQLGAMVAEFDAEVTRIVGRTKAPNFFLVERKSSGSSPPELVATCTSHPQRSK